MSSVQRTSAPRILVDGLTVVRAGRRILDAVDLAVAPDERVGLLGANGVGKSTLIAALAGTLDADSGRIATPRSLGVLAQELEPDRRTPRMIVDAAVAPVRRLERDLERAAAMLGSSGAVDETYSAALDAAERGGLWDLDARIARVFTSLSVAEFAPDGSRADRPLHELSGGQRRRLALAALLVERPEALLLDEPTNHLDDSAAEFLVAELMRWRGPVLVASHDRAFLDEAATSLVDLDAAPGAEGARGSARTARRYGGGFSAYLDVRARELAHWQAEYAAEQDERARLERVIDVDARSVFHTSAPRGEGRIAKKFEADRAAKTIGGRLRQARSRLAELDRAPVPRPPIALEFAGFLAAERTPERVARLDGVAVERRLAPVSLELRRGSRVLVEGPNGAGKSTLLGVLEGRLTPDAGARTVFGRIGGLRQTDDWDDLGITATEAYRRALRRPDRAPTLTELGLLDEAAAQLPLVELSYGQRRRVALAGLLAEPPALLLLDEPTNHLALGLANDLERALERFPGAVVLASHDRWLRRRWTGTRLRLEPVAPDRRPTDRRPTDGRAATGR